MKKFIDALVAVDDCFNTAIVDDDFPRVKSVMHRCLNEVAQDLISLRGVPIVCLCGSTKFKEEYETWNHNLTMKGCIVLSVGSFIHADKHFVTVDEKLALDDLHKRKIDLADTVYIINPKGYIGDSTRSEIEYAQKRNKDIQYLEPVK